MGILYAENVVEMNSMSENILAGILAEMGDICSFDEKKKIQELREMGLVAYSSGRHKGQEKISCKERKQELYTGFSRLLNQWWDADNFKKVMHIIWQEMLICLRKCSC